MTDRIEARVVRHSELELLFGKVTSDGGELRQFSGSDYGLATSAIVAEVAPGSGARRHRHPLPEVFVLHDGQGRFEVEGTYFEAEAGDIVIIPPDAWHSFRNTGTGMLRQTAIHQNGRAVTSLRTVLGATEEAREPSDCATGLRIPDESLRAAFRVP